MNASDRDRDRKLPSTAEVGSEGGSQADATMQSATFADEKGIARAERGEPFPPADATRMDDVAASGVGANPEPASGMLRYPTEAPAHEGDARARKSRWIGGAVGAAAGAAGAALLMSLNRRRRRR